MTEQMVWTIIGTCLYVAAYLIISTGTTLLWKRWAVRKTNVFLRYNLGYEIKKLYPGFYSFVAEHPWAYNCIYVCLWPIMLPIQLSMYTKAVNHSLRYVCYY